MEKPKTKDTCELYRIDAKRFLSEGALKSKIQRCVVYEIAFLITSAEKLIP